MKLEFLKFNQRNLGAFLGFCIILLCSLPSHAQEMTVTGTVTIDEGEGMPGATVQIKGTTNGAVTDFNGNYSLKATMGDILVVSFVGMTTQEIIVTGSSHDFYMSQDIDELEEVIVIGYGAQKKKEVTGAVARIKSDELNKFLSPDLGMSIQGRIAGVNVTSQSGEPGEGSSILIRGVTSIAGGNGPLYVVDGVPQDGDPRIPNSEIQTIDVLKDAASASIYGVRAAGGVILITTKTGEAGKAKVNFEASTGISALGAGADIPLLNTEEALYHNSQRIKYVGAGETDILTNPDWILNNTDIRGLVLNDGAKTSNYSFNVSGGQKNFSYNAIMGYMDQEGIMVNSRLKRFNGRLTTSYKEGNTSIRTSLGYTHENDDRMGAGLLFWALTYDPYYPEVDFDTEEITVTGGPSETKGNNLLRRLKNVNNIKRDRFNGSTNISHEITKGLTIGVTAGAGISDNLNTNFIPSYRVFNSATQEYEVQDPTKSYIRFTTQRFVNWSVNPSVTYKKKFGKHNVTGLASYQVNERSKQEFIAEAQGIVDPNLQILNNGQFAQLAYNNLNSNYVTREVGIIGRVLYDYDRKYLLSASVRRDGSSKFGPDNRWGTFPSVSAGWNISDEAFWDGLSSIVNFTKIRVGVGTTGNESFDPYSYSGFIGTGYDYLDGSNQVLPGAAQLEFSNADVFWETSVQSNIGADLGLFENKLTLNIDYYNTEKRDMIFPIQLPPSAGVPLLGSYGLDETVPLNVGNMINQGVEIAARYQFKKKDLRLNLSATYAKNRNEITEIFGETLGYFNSGGISVIGDPTSVISKIQVGHEAGSFFLYETDGIITSDIPDSELYGFAEDGVTALSQLTWYQQYRSTADLGDLIYVDQLTVDTDEDGIPDAGDGVFTPDDQVYAGSGLPDFEIGFNIDAQYKGFDLSMQWYASVGNEVYNGARAWAHINGRHKNLLNMWTPENPDATFPIHQTTDKADINYRGLTDLWIEDGSFVRLKLVTLGYTLPKSVIDRAGFDQVRVYVSAQNPLTFTKYKGYDPEIGGNLLNKGIDKGSYPIYTQYLFGVQLQF